MTIDTSRSISDAARWGRAGYLALATYREYGHEFRRFPKGEQRNNRIAFEVRERRKAFNSIGLYIGTSINEAVHAINVWIDNGVYTPF